MKDKKIGNFRIVIRTRELHKPTPGGLTWEAWTDAIREIDDSGAEFMHEEKLKGMGMSEKEASEEVEANFAAWVARRAH
jgi:hypothetical protein